MTIKSSLHTLFKTGLYIFAIVTALIIVIHFSLVIASILTPLNLNWKIIFGCEFAFSLIAILLIFPVILVGLVNERNKFDITIYSILFIMLIFVSASAFLGYVQIHDYEMILVNPMLGIQRKLQYSNSSFILLVISFALSIIVGTLGISRLIISKLWIAKLRERTQRLP